MSAYLERKLVDLLVKKEPRLLELYDFDELLSEARAFLKPLDDLAGRLLIVGLERKARSD